MAASLKDLSFEIPIIHNCRDCQPKRFLSEYRFSDLAGQESENLLLTFSVIARIIKTKERSLVPWSLAVSKLSGRPINPELIDAVCGRQYRLETPERSL